MNNKTKGIIFILISAFSFALMSTFVKLSGDLPSIEKSFFRNLVSCVVAFYLVRKDKSLLFGHKENRLALIGRATLGTLGIWANYYAIDNLILSDATILNKLSPFFVIIFSYLFLKEKLKPIHIISLFVAFTGVLFIVRPSGSLASNIMPALIGLCSAAFAFSQDIITNGPENYMSFLKKGGSNYPIELLKESGINLYSTKPIEKTVEKFNSLVSELEKLLKN